MSTRPAVRSVTHLIHVRRIRRRAWSPATLLTEIPDNTGIYLAAYADLGNYTNNSTALAIARDTAISAMTSDEFNDSRGILKKGVGSNLTAPSWFITNSPELVRFLQNAYPYFDADLQGAIVQYTNIQYWAITQLDSDSKTAPLLYGRNWTGPAFEIATNQTVTLVIRLSKYLQRVPN